MAVKIGPRIGIEGEKEYRKSLENIIQQAKALDSEMKAVTAAFAENADEQEKAAATGKVLTRQIDTQQRLVDELTKAVQDATRELGENDTTTLKWRRALNDATAELRGMENRLGAAEKETDDFGEELQDAEKSALSFGDIVGANIISDAFMNGLRAAADLVADLAREFVDFAKDGVELASDLEEVQNVVDVTFGKGKKVIEEFAEGAAEGFGLSALSAKQFSGTMGAMLKSMGLTEEAVLEMSVSLTGLAGDIASFYNIDAEEAFNKLRSGISGETEPLKQLGINMSVANLEAYALAQGIETAFSKMTQAEQATLRYNYILQTTAAAQGDFARTAEGYANQQRILQLNIENLQSAIGEGLLPTLTEATSVLNELISGDMSAGEFLSWVTEGAENLVGSVKENLPEVETAFSELSGEITRSIRGLLNTAGPELAEIGTELIGILAESLSTGGVPLAMALISALAGIGTELIGVLAESLSTDGVLLAMALISALLSAAEQILPELPAIIQTIATSIAEQLPMVIRTVTVSLLGLLPTLTTGILEMAPDLLSAALNLAIEVAKYAVTEAVPALLRELPAIVENAVNFLKEAAPMLIEAGTELFSAMVDNMDGIIDAVLEIIPLLLDSIADFLIGDGLPKLIEAGYELLSSIVSKLPEIIIKVLAAIYKIVGQIATAFTDPQQLAKMIEAGVKLLVALVKNAAQAGREIAKSVPGIVKQIASAFGNMVSSMATAGLNLVKGIGQGILNGASWLWNLVKGFCNDLLGKIKGFLGIHSPSDETEYDGNMLMEGLIVAIKKRTRAAVSAAAEMCREVTGTIEDMMSDAVSAGGVFNIKTNIEPLTGTALKNTIDLPGGTVQGARTVNLSINVYGAEGQSVEELADIVMNRIQTGVDEREAVFA